MMLYRRGSSVVAQNTIQYNSKYFIKELFLLLFEILLQKDIYEVVNLQVTNVRNGQYV